MVGLSFYNRKNRCFFVALHRIRDFINCTLLLNLQYDERNRRCEIRGMPGQKT